MLHNIQSDHIKQTYTISRIFMVAIVIATVLNGTSFWLKRVGLLEPQMYQLYKENIYTYGEPDVTRYSERFKTLTRSTYQTEGVWTAFKASKDVIFLLFISYSLYDCSGFSPRSLQKSR